ncbi:helix-turn-helix domain-containing protein [Mycolicibacter algericus]|nr:helix-turn-helix domain-containing protein [Mycolicibacter algericus]OQZ93198.1 AraC family transcriptional regulator [Mycolicibacter algericus DSM 45454]
MMGPRLFRPRQPLAESVEYFGYWDRRTGGAHQSRALPRGAATIVIDVGDRPEVDFFATDGRTRLPVPPAFLIGAGTASYVTQIDAPQTVVTVHFRAGGALPFLGTALGDLTDACVGIGELWGHEAIALRERLADAPSAAARVSLVETFLLNRMRVEGFSVDPGVAAVLACAEHNPSMRVADAVALTGLSHRRLITLFRDQLGLRPKAYLRVRRLQAALRRLHMGPVSGAAIAAELGYFDQAHFVREFRAFTETTPAEYQRRRSWLPGHVDFVDSDKNIQDGRRRHPR